MQRKYSAVLAGLAVVAISAGACSSDDDNNDVTATPSPTATATATQEATETASPAPTVSATDDEARAGGILAALNFIDGAGFHGMDEALNGDAPAIQASWLGQTTHARLAAQAVDWPSDLQAAVDAFVAATTDLEAALSADDAAAAAEPAAAAHETQHALSHDAYHHLGEMAAADDSAGGMLAALLLIDGAGFHGMDETLNGDAPAIEAGWVGATNRARIAAQVISWPSDVQAVADEFIAAATALEEALDADDAATAAEHAAAAHETQHALSHDAYEAAGSMAGSDESPVAMLTALKLIGSAGLHGMDDALNGDAPAIEARWVGAVTRALIATRAVSWSGDLQPLVETFVTEAEALVAALEADDVEQAGPASAAAHDAAHALEHDAYAALGGDGASH